MGDSDFDLALRVRVAVMTGGVMVVGRKTDWGFTNDDVIPKRSVSGRVSNRIPSKRHKTERMIAVVLIFAAVIALAVESRVLSALFLAVAVTLYVHSRLIALWSDED